MKILLLGSLGQLGWELHRTLVSLGEVAAFDSSRLDLTNGEATRKLIRSIRPNVIVNAAAYTAVDQAENEPELAEAINSKGPAILAEEALSAGTALIHYSTDYVFDGKKNAPYDETDRPNPLNVYGRTKLSGEQAIRQIAKAYLIIRTSWLYSLRRNSFVNKVLQWSRQKRELKVVADQIGDPTWARTLAETTSQLLTMGHKDIASWLEERSGLYHVAGDGCASRFEWANAILSLDPRREEQIVESVAPALTTDFPTPAQRPLFSALACRRFTETFGLQLPPWKLALQLAMEE